MSFFAPPLRSEFTSTALPPLLRYFICYQFYTPPASPPTRDTQL